MKKLSIYSAIYLSNYTYIYLFIYQPGSDSSALTTKKEGLPSDFFGMKDLQHNDA